MYKNLRFCIYSTLTFRGYKMIVFPFLIQDELTTFSFCKIHRLSILFHSLAVFIMGDTYVDAKTVLDSVNIPHICHGCADGVRVNFFWPMKIFTDLTRKIGIFDRFYAKKGRFFTDLTRKIGVFRCKFYSPKILPV